MKPDQSGGRQSSPRVQQKRRQARHEILQAAQKILHAGGTEAITLDAVAGALGMTKQALYHYFPSKEALLRSLVTSFVDDEIEVLVRAVEASASREATLGTLIQAFYNHYINNLGAFRAVYCQSQLYSAPGRVLDKETIRDNINPRTQRLFDSLEARLSSDSVSNAQRERLRRLAFTAWTAALGLVTMLGVADAVQDPLVHTDKDLLETLVTVFDEAARR